MMDMCQSCQIPVLLFPQQRANHGNREVTPHFALSCHTATCDLWPSTGENRRGNRTVHLSKAAGRGSAEGFLPEETGGEQGRQTRRKERTLQAHPPWKYARKAAGLGRADRVSKQRAGPATRGAGRGGGGGGAL
ncbi:unnamed protein product [Ectocarpus sp. 6 AP-2014]